MDIRDLSRTDLRLLCAAVGDRRWQLVSAVFRAIVDERGLDVHIVREARGYMLLAIETSGDAVVRELRMPVAWTEIGENVRVWVLHLYLQGVLAGYERWRRRVGLQATLVPPAPPAND